MKSEIYILWVQGWDEAPYLVKKCAESWIKKNPTFKVHLIDKHNLKNYVVEEMPKNEMTIQAFSDCFRIQLLKGNNGIWVDATCFCHKPLDSWIHNINSDFFAFSNPTRDKLVASWFLVSKKQNLIIDRWHSQTNDFWKNKNHKVEYFWFHKLFNKCYNSDSEFEAKWDCVEKIGCDVEKSEGPHYFVPYQKSFSEILTEERLNEIKNLNTPVFKLTWKNNFNHNSLIKGILDG